MFYNSGVVLFDSIYIEPGSWFAVEMNWLVSRCYGFLRRCFIIRVVLIFNYEFSCVKKFNCPIGYSVISLGRDSFVCGDRSVDKQWG